jgi:hypothetical protein
MLLGSLSIARAQEEKMEGEEHKPLPQRHELVADLVILIEQKLSGGNGTVRYTFFAQPLDRLDPDVIPGQRKFLRHPNSLSVMLHRLTTQYDQINGGALAGTLTFGDLVTLDGEIGLDLVNVKQDPFEGGYLALPYRLELQTYALPRTRIGAFVEGKRVLNPTRQSEILFPTERESGGELEIGGSIAGCSCGDRLYGELRAGWKNVEYNFSGSFEGDLTAKGPAISGMGLYQFSETTSLGLRGDFETLQWETTRTGDRDRLEGSISPRALRVDLSLELIFWYKGTYGLKVSLGGGLQQQRPLFADEDSGFGHFGFAVTTRF